MAGCITNESPPSVTELPPGCRGPVATLRTSDASVRVLLLASVFTIATCGLVYELVAGTIASYLLGDSVTQFSTVIGVYLFAMGIGSWLSRYVERSLVRTFIQVEFLIALFGGSSAAMFFSLFPYVSSFRVLLYADVLLIGTLVGLEVPLLLRILKDRLNFKDLISKVFTFDYIGALLASLLFPLVLVPYCGIARSGFLFGILNGVVGLVALWVLWDEIPRPAALRTSGIATLALLCVGFVYSERMVAFSEAANYGEDIVFSKSTPYQRITLTRRADDIRLYLNGNLQFSSRDEYRYHESLVHPGLALLPKARRVLVLGGGDGLAVREILRYQWHRERDAGRSRSCHDAPLFNPGNAHLPECGCAYKSPQVHVINADAFLMAKRKPRTSLISLSRTSRIHRTSPSASCSPPRSTVVSAERSVRGSLRDPMHLSVRCPEGHTGAWTRPCAHAALSHAPTTPMSLPLASGASSLPPAIPSHRSGFFPKGCDS